MRAAAILAIPLVTVGCAHADVTATSSSAPQTNTTAALDHAQQQIENWRRSHLSAFATLGDAMVANDWSAIHTECAELTEATHAMYDALPTPDERLNAAFKGALDNLNAAMIECPSLNAGSDRIDAHTFITNVERAMEQMNVVKDILK
jgi:acyl carrier protein phosphodiesterase